MKILRLVLILMLVTNIVYTLIVIKQEGMNLLSVFFGNMTAMGWSGQFNLDFMSMLLLCGGWVAWRHRFSAAGIALGLLASVGGILFLSSYLLILSFREQGDFRRMLLGEQYGE